MNETREETPYSGTVVAVSRSDAHSFSKQPCASIRLIRGEGVEGDAHRGVTVKHRSRVARDPNQPNLRQVHLIHSELLDELHEAGFSIAPGELGENVTTRGIALLELPKGTRLCMGAEAIVELTGLRNPCVQIDRFQSGLLSAVIGRDEAGRITRKTGVMSVVVRDGEIHRGDPIRVELPAEPHRPLDVV
ncbi:MAG TPA: MOSC domain-containing protein [Gemmatimonadaceae bacterium]|nr:MOSC domain-containing protein [Gemmatimonadaceae bacterium]